MGIATEGEEMLTRSDLLWAEEEEMIAIFGSERDFKEKFTFVPKFEELEPIESYRIERRDGKKLYGFPRNTKLPKGVEVVNDFVTSDEIDFNFIGEMWENQEPAILDFVDCTKKGVYDVILSADTGAGKTVMLLKMASLLRQKALVVVPKTDLMDQWKERILKFMDIEEEDIGIIRQKKCQYENKKIMIGMIHSLSKDYYPEEFKRTPGLIIFDELHKLGANTFSRVGGMFPAKYRLGATATLRRADGMAKVFYAHLGDRVVRPLAGEQPKPKIFEVKYSKGSGDIPHWCESKVQRRGPLLTLLANNEERTSWIVYYILEVNDSTRRILVLSERLEHLSKIKKHLVSKGIPKEEVGLYTGKTSPTQREKIAKSCKIILATTSMLSLGTDIPTLKGLVFATPVADAEQAIGRICRYTPDAEFPLVIDIVDTHYRETRMWSRGRRALYGRKGWEVIEGN